MLRMQKTCPETIDFFEDKPKLPKNTKVKE